MKTILRPDEAKAFSVWDLMIVLVTVALVFFLLPIFARPRHRTTPSRINCVSNLKQIGLAFRMWSNDHEERFPMNLSTNKGGSLEFIDTGEVFRHFLAISNELNSPKVLTCNADSRQRVATFDKLKNENLSYFVGLDADETRPQTILSGDRNVTTNGRLMSGILVLTSNSPVSWTKDIHQYAGNIGLGDGSAQQVNDMNLRKQVNSNTNFPLRLAIP
jgi:hypothetical protein